MDPYWLSEGQGPPNSQAGQEITYTPYIDLTLFSSPPGPVEEPHNHEEGNNCSGGTPRPANGKGNKVLIGVAQRSSNYQGVDDEVLCSAYLNISKDPIVGVNQSTTSYWQRIAEYYNANRKTPTARTRNSLQHRWSDIQKEVTKFCAFYDKIVRRNQSGQSDDDKVKEAMLLYEGTVETTFKFLHCWLILKNQSKWNDHLAQVYVNQSKKKTESETPAPSEDIEPSDGGTGRKYERPMGRNHAKKQRSLTSSSSSSAYLDVLQKMQLERSAYEERVEAATVAESEATACRYERKLALQEKLVSIQERQADIANELLQMKKQDREERVMSADVDRFAPWVTDWYITKQKEIAAKSMSSSSSQQTQDPK